MSSPGISPALPGGLALKRSAWRGNVPSAAALRLLLRLHGYGHPRLDYRDAKIGHLPEQGMDGLIRRLAARNQESGS